MIGMDDRQFTTRALACLGEAVPPAGLNRRLLDTYEARTRRGFSRLAELVWPGAPAWAPGMALAAALLLGIGAGMALPSPAMAGRMGFSLEEPPSLSIESLLAEPR